MYIFLHTSPEKKTQTAYRTRDFHPPRFEDSKINCGIKLLNLEISPSENYAANHIAKL